MKLLPIIVLCGVTGMTSIFGEETIKLSAETLEAAKVKSGSIMIKGYMEPVIFEFSGRSHISITAQESVDVASGRRTYGMNIEVDPGNNSRRNRSWIDEDEFESLIAGMEQLSKIDKTATRMAHFMAQYRSRGDLVITVCDWDDGDLITAISAGRESPTAAYMKQSDLAKIAEAIVKTKAAIDDLKK
jgi:hypothetical protein